MSLLWPLGLLALAGVPAAILLALWRAQRRNLVVPSLVIWQKLAERAAEGRTRHRRLIDASLLFAALTALFLGVTASGPYLQLWSAPGRNFLLIVDRSASMSIRQNDTPRWAVARQQAQKLVDSLDAADRVYLAASPADAQILRGPLTPGDLKDALAAMAPALRSADLTKDATQAIAAAHGYKPVQTFIITDAPEAVPVTVSDSQADIEVIAVGGPADNAFFTRFGTADGKALFGIRNVGSVKTARVELTLDGALVQSRQVTLDAEAERTLIFDEPQLEQAQILEGRIAVDDALTADNAFYAVRPSQAKVRILLAGKENVFLRRALTAAPSVELIRGQAGALPEENAYDLLVYNEVVPKADTGNTPTVVIAPPESFGEFTTGGTISDTAVTSLAESPLVQDSMLGGLKIASARKMAGPADVLADSPQGPLIARDKNVLCIAFALTPETSRWVYTPGFPVFWAKLLEQTADAGPKTLEYEPLTAATALEIGDGVVKMLLPTEQSITQTKKDTYFTPEKPGIYEIVNAGATNNTIACNLMDAGESQTNGSERPFDPTMVKPKAAAGTARNLPLTAVFAALAFASVLAHWYTRK